MFLKRKTIDFIPVFTTDKNWLVNPKSTKQIN
jgi:hypothetical protein